MAILLNSFRDQFKLVTREAREVLRTDSNYSTISTRTTLPFFYLSLSDVLSFKGVKCQEVFSSYVGKEIRLGKFSGGPESGFFGTFKCSIISFFCGTDQTLKGID